MEESGPLYEAYCVSNLATCGTAEPRDRLREGERERGGQKGKEVSEGEEEGSTRGASEGRGERGTPSTVWEEGGGGGARGWQNQRCVYTSSVGQWVPPEHPLFLSSPISSLYDWPGSAVCNVKRVK